MELILIPKDSLHKEFDKDGKEICFDYKLFPNPFSFETILRTNDNLRNATLTIYYSYGQQVKQIKNICSQTIVVHRDNLPSGLYYVSLTQGNKTLLTDKLIITD